MSNYTHICIDDREFNNGVYPVEFMEKVTVLGMSNVYKDHYYLKEYPVTMNGLPCSYGAYRFIPLSNIDEMELAEQRLQTA